MSIIVGIVEYFKIIVILALVVAINMILIVVYYEIIKYDRLIADTLQCM